MSNTSKPVELTANIVAAYLGGNTLPVSEVPGLIKLVYHALAGSAPSPKDKQNSVLKPTPLEIRRSITQDALINFEDGKSYKSLKPNLSTRGMTAEQYRAKWGLPPDYPMVAPSYSATRSALAKSAGFGYKGGRPRGAAAPGPSARSPKARPGAEPRA